MRQPVKCPRTGLWLARYTAPDGRVLQVGQLRAQARRAEGDRGGDASRARSRGSLRCSSTFFDEWLERFPRHPANAADQPRSGSAATSSPTCRAAVAFPITELRRASLQARPGRASQARASRRRRSTERSRPSRRCCVTPSTIELLDANPAHGIRVRPNDPRLNPTTHPNVSAAPYLPEEVGAFIAAVPPQTPRGLLGHVPHRRSAGRAVRLVARGDLDRQRQMIYVHQTVNRYGRLEPGLKTTHHVRDRERRGRWTLFPSSLIAMVESVPADIEGRLFPSPRG